MIFILYFICFAIAMVVLTHHAIKQHGFEEYTKDKTMRGLIFFASAGWPATLFAYSASIGLSKLRKALKIKYWYE